MTAVVYTGKETLSLASFYPIFLCYGLVFSLYFRFYFGKLVSFVSCQVSRCCDRSLRPNVFPVSHCPPSLCVQKYLSFLPSLLAYCMSPHDLFLLFVLLLFLASTEPDTPVLTLTCLVTFCLINDCAEAALPVAYAFGSKPLPSVSGRLKDSLLILLVNVVWTYTTSYCKTPIFFVTVTHGNKVSELCPLHKVK